MTLRQLQKRINELIAENDRMAAHLSARMGEKAENRNDLPLAVRLDRRPLKPNGARGYKSRFVAIEHLESTRHGLGDAGDFICFTASEDEGLIWPKTKTGEPREAATLLGGRK